MKIPLAVAYCYALSRGFFAIWDEEWTAIKTGLRSLLYYQDHPEELGFVSEKPRSQGVKRKAGKSNSPESVVYAYEFFLSLVVSLETFQKSQFHQERRLGLGNSGHE